MQDTKLNVLMGYLARGWALVPLHDVSAGACSCRSGAQCSNPGKHPRWSEWQRDPQLVRDHTRLTELHTSAPQWNWGVATGEASRVFVLDWDSSHDLEIRAWLEANIEGDWQPDECQYYAPDLDTLTLGPTGGGGWHYVFALPAEGWIPTGSQTRNRYGLPPGLDVRGVGGQIVVHPSVSSKGGYGAILLDRPVTQAPGWLLDMLRPQPVDKAVHNTAGAAGLGTVLAPASTDRLHAYAIAAVRGALEELQTAPEGTRNDTAARTARRVLELVQSDWTGLDFEQVQDLWHMAGEVSGLPFGEINGVWTRAVRAMAGKAIDPPALSEWGGEYIPFAPMAPQTGAMPPDPFMNPDGYSSNGVGGNGSAQVDPFEHAVSIEMGKLLVREEARRRHDAAKLGNPDEQLAMLRAALVDSAGLDDLPELEPLIDGMFWRNTFCRVIGESTHGKSFVMLDMAGCVGSGIPWAGRETRQGNVVYLIAEGATGIRARVRAWERSHQRKMEGVRFLMVPVQATSAQWSIFVRLAVELAPAFIIGDTQARLTVDVDENSAQDMGVVVAAMEELRQATGACVTLVHHKGPRGDGRGSKSVRGALQTELDVSRKDQIVTVTTTKQKDAAEAEPIVFELAPVNIALDAWADEQTVPVPIWLPDGAGSGQRVEPADLLVSEEALSGMTARAARVLAKITKGNGLTRAEIISLLGTKGRETFVCSRAEAYRMWDRDLLPLKIIGNIVGTARWTYIPVDKRAEIISYVNGADSSQGIYAPMSQ